MQSAQSIIIILLVANLLATFWFGTQDRAPAAAPAAVTPKAEQPVSQQLPELLNEEVRNALLEQFVTAFNAEDFGQVYAMLGPAARTQIDEQETLDEFRKLAQFFHGIEEGAFTHATLNASQGNTSVYTLHYLVKLPESSEFGTRGKLMITVAVQADSYQVYAIRLNGG